MDDEPTLNADDTTGKLSEMAVDIVISNNKYTIDEDLADIENGGDDFLQKSTA